MVNGLGYYGSVEQKNMVINRMKKHIEMDDLATSIGYLDKHPTGKIRGCSVSCLAIDSFNALGSLLPLIHTSIPALIFDDCKKTLYDTVESLLNIPNIGPLIDIFHETTDSEVSFDPGVEPEAMINFNLQVLDLIQLDVDYSTFFTDYVKMLYSEFSSKSIDRYEDLMATIYTPEALAKRNDIRERLHDIVEITGLDYNNFLNYLKEYNEKAKLVTS